ncbi:MAG: TonB-dependent receptor plug domain-containing protein, partial [Bacteroidetes bacterium]|nr:TonB-dependent receptor plug domain-containing protein [Bacteroidota bacterium]
MKNKLPFLFLLGIILGNTPPLYAQTFARAEQPAAMHIQADQSKTRKLREVLNELKSQHKVDILFFGSDIENYEVPAVSYNPAKPLEENLYLILSPLRLKFKKTSRGGYVITEKKSQSPLEKVEKVGRLGIVPGPVNHTGLTGTPASPQLPAISVAAIAVADVTISGKVTSGDNNEPLPGVSVLIKGLTRGTTTDAEGAFSLPVPGPNSVLVFSFVGYVSKEIPVGNRTNFNVVLNEDLKSLEEVVVVGYNTTARKNILGSVGSVKADQIEQTTPVNAFDAVQGRLAGVQISSNGGPGAGAEIRIRGTSTFSGGVNPLYIVDGQQLDDIDNLNPADIASIEVLKDGASAAIYGSKSANGVVIITTKTGKPGELKLDVDYTRVYSTLASSIPTANT